MNSAKNLIGYATDSFEIFRRPPHNDVVGQPLRGDFWVDKEKSPLFKGGYR